MQSEAAMLAVLRDFARRFGDAKIRARPHDGGEAARRFRLYRDLIEADLPRASI